MSLRVWVYSILGLLVLGVVALLMWPVSPSKEMPIDAGIDSTVTVPGPETLPADAKKAQAELAKARAALGRLQPKTAYIVIDTHRNKLAYRTTDTILYEFDCSTGSGGELIDSATGRRWIFDTPRGAFKVLNKMTEPWWRKPDWAFIEEGEPVPKKESERLDPNVMGDYALGFGDGYFIHGTIYERLLGINVTHGCVRVGSDDLDVLYKRVPIGTPIYIF